MSPDTITEPEKTTVTVTGVFAQFVTTRKRITGKVEEVARTAFKGETVEMPKTEADRLAELGMVRELSAQTVLDRALNPSDNVREGAVGGTQPVTVSPPSLGVPPQGDLTTGDTGTADVQPPPETPGGSEPRRAVEPPAPEEAGDGFDARGKTLDEVRAWLREQKPNGPATIAAANDDAEAAETIVEAEKLVRGSDPRTTVVTPLQAIIDGAGGQPEGGGVTPPAT